MVLSRWHFSCQHLWILPPSLAWFFSMLTCSQLPSSETLCENETHSSPMIQPSKFLVSVDPNESIAYIYSEACTRMFRAALFRTARAWKQPRCPLGGEWTHRVGYIHATECSSALKRQERDMEPWGDRWGTWNAYYSLKEGNLESWHTLGYQLHMIFGKRQTMERVRRSLQHQGFVAGLRGEGW